MNAYQQCGWVHPFTCGNSHEGERVLVATADGWICPSCDYKQDWAHVWMTNWQWRELLKPMSQLFNNPNDNAK